MGVVVERCCDDGTDEVCDEDGCDWSVYENEDHVVDKERGHPNYRPTEHAPIKMTLEEFAHRLKLSVSRIFASESRPLTPSQVALIN